MARFIKNKKGMVTSIGLVVFFTLLVCGVSLFFFVTQKNRIQDTIYVSIFTEQISKRELLLDSYLQTVTDRSAKNSKTKAEFISKFNNYLHNDKIPKDFFLEIAHVKEQLNEENVELSDTSVSGEVGKTFSLKLNLVIVPYGQLNLPGQNVNKVSIEYDYDKAFQAKS